MIPVKIRASNPRRVFDPAPRRLLEQAVRHDDLRPVEKGLLTRGTESAEPQRHAG